MGWSLGYDRKHDRWRGYGVPAYCDAVDCGIEIDRGMGYLCDCDECYETEADLSLFLCGKHKHTDVDETNLPPEHPEWIEFMLTDESWQRWRDENPDKVAALANAPAPQAGPDA